MKRTYNIHDLVRMRISWARPGPLHGFLERMFAHYRSPIDGDDLVVEVGRFRRCRKSCFHAGDGCRAGQDCLCSTQRHKIAKWRVEVAGLRERPVIARVHGNVFSGRIFPRAVVQGLVAYTLMRRGASLVPGCALERDGKALMIAGRTGVGKTLLTLMLVLEGFRWLGDDSVIFRNGEVLSFATPFQMRFCRYNRTARRAVPIRLGWRRRVAVWSRRLLAAATRGYIDLYTPVYSSDLPAGTCAEHARLSAVVFLSKADGYAEAVPLSHDEAVERLLRNQHIVNREFLRMLSAWGARYGDAPGSDWDDAQRRIISETIRGVPILEMHVPQRPNPHETLERLRQIIAQL